MDFFNCSAEKLAKIFAENPSGYNAAKDFFNAIKGREILSRDMEKSVDRTIDLINKANDIARNSDYFVFNIYDSWCERTDGVGYGYGVFQKVGDELIRKLTQDQTIPEFEDVVSFLKKREVSRAFTLTPPLKGYCGLKHEQDMGDGDIAGYEEVEEHMRRGFAENGIELILLNVH